MGCSSIISKYVSRSLDCRIKGLEWTGALQLCLHENKMKKAGCALYISLKCTLKGNVYWDKHKGWHWRLLILKILFAKLLWRFNGFSLFWIHLLYDVHFFSHNHCIHLQFSRHHCTDTHLGSWHCCAITHFLSRHYCTDLQLFTALMHTSSFTTTVLLLECILLLSSLLYQQTLPSILQHRWAPLLSLTTAL